MGGERDRAGLKLTAWMNMQSCTFQFILKLLTIASTGLNIQIQKKEQKPAKATEATGCLQSQKNNTETVCALRINKKKIK